MNNNAKNYKLNMKRYKIKRTQHNIINSLIINPAKTLLIKYTALSENVIKLADRANVVLLFKGMKPRVGPILRQIYRM